MKPIPAIYLTLHARAQAQRMNPETLAKAIAFFQSHPQSEDCYVCHNGKVFDGESYRRGFSVRFIPQADGELKAIGGTYGNAIAQMATDGIPLNVSRFNLEVSAALNGPSWFDKIKERYAQR